MQGLLIYVFGFSISVLLITLAEKNKDIKSKKIYRNILIIIALAIPITISSIRYNVGTDYKNYVGLYNKYATTPLQNIFLVTEVETFFVLVSKIAYIFNNVQVMFFIYSTFTVGITFKALWERKDKISISLMWFLYLFMIFGNSMNMVRQALAIAIIAYSYKYIENRQLWKFIICIILAMNVHKTAIIMLPLYFVLNFKNYNKKDEKIRNFVRILLLIISFFCIVCIEEIILFLVNFRGFEKYITYANYDGNINNYSFLLKIIIFIFITIFIMPMIKYNEKNKLYYYLLLLELVLSLLGYKSPYLARVSYYFSITEIFLLAQIPKVLRIKEEKQMITLCIMFYALAKFILTVYILKQGNLIPYITIFNK